MKQGIRRIGALLATAALAAGVARAQGSARPRSSGQVSTSGTVPAVLLSDLHFDPFHDPAKLPRLRATPVSGWAVILSAPASPDQAEAFDALQKTCGAGGVDTPFALLRSSLHAAALDAPHPAFVTVSGDLLVHDFDCRFRTLTAGTGGSGDHEAFAEKTVEFLALQLREAFRGVPVYLALGNNDSSCDDYREDRNSAFLQAAATAFAEDVVSPANRAALLASFPDTGSYSTALPAPVQRGRLLVLQDIFASRKYAGCDGAKDHPAPADGLIAGAVARSGAEAQLAWLRAQLTAARAAGEGVWVMAHIPPGVDVYSTFRKPHNVCGGGKPEMFLADESLAALLTEFSDVVRLALFGHTHMDEMRLLQPLAGAPGGDVAAKLVPSISPVDGNLPAFTIARVDPKTLVLKDYTVYAANDDNGTRWSEEYRFRDTYRQPDFSHTSLRVIADGFLADKAAATEPSRAYQRNFFVGNTGLRALALGFIWPAYGCAVTQDGAPGFRTCMCAAAPTNTPAR